MKLEFDRQIFGKKSSNIKFHENPSSGSRVPSEQTDGQTDTTKLIVAFRYLTKAPKKLFSSGFFFLDSKSSSAVRR
jgi:hypothetical protein